MVALPLVHVSWALAHNRERPAVDGFFLDVFSAETAGEILITPETESLGLDREERLMVIGDTMLIPIAPAGAGERPDSPIGGMLRRNAGAMRWIGLALRVADLPSADAWLRARGFTLHYDPGMESHYFLIGRKQVLGMRLELLGHPLTGDPREEPGWRPERWRNEHPLGIVGLQSIGVSVPSLDAARQVFAARLDWPEISAGPPPEDETECAAFALGDTVIEALCPTTGNTRLARHLREVQGIYCLTFQVRDVAAAADYLRGRGLRLTGDPEVRFAIEPDDAHGRLIWFTEQVPEGYPPAGRRRSPPAHFAA